MTKACIAIIFCVFLMSCSSSKTDIFGKKIIIPEQVQWKVYDKDTIVAIDSTKPSVLIYYNTQGCQSCRMKELVEWKNLMSEVENMPEDSDSSKVNFIFLFAVGDNETNLTISLLSYKFAYPVIWDKYNSFESCNPIPKDELLHCFLLDKNNTVKLVGSPVYNRALWRLYKREIAKLNSGQK